MVIKPLKRVKICIYLRVFNVGMGQVFLEMRTSFSEQSVLISLREVPDCQEFVFHLCFYHLARLKSFVSFVANNLLLILKSEILGNPSLKK